MSVYTVCFSGTACTRDEGEKSRKESDRDIYTPDTGYIPVRIHKEITGTLEPGRASASVRGVGENDWSSPRNDSEPLRLDGPLNVPPDLLKYAQPYSGGNQFSYPSQINGWAAVALALHGANLAAASGAAQYNLIGHSRGAAECVMAAWFLYAYGRRDVAVNIFAIDPVPGSGEWYGILTQLPPNVVNFTGIYAWDHVGGRLDAGFMALVPRPNARQCQEDQQPPTLGKTWKTLADHNQGADPLRLQPGRMQPKGYQLYACRGRHGTVTGNRTSDGMYDASKADPTVAPVPELIYKLAREHLSDWGTLFETPCAVQTKSAELSEAIHKNHATFDKMGGGANRTSTLPWRPLVRRISSISGVNPANYYYLEDVAGVPPAQSNYPVTSERDGRGWVDWSYL
ncbi:Tat pathway signal protein [Duganella sp. BJB1802]|uniref:Tat pathway signal protein n=1 Tax=Duganella sp. BJB1802 TaxID=2744575 RepID=UPI00159435E1|nr:Tat pathway signal protein [Duganella sp. BJB1802]NVD70641.1 Tat pathway signal protein [Duganella sp. BJB1802]